MFLKLFALLVYCIGLYVLNTIINLYQCTDSLFTQDAQQYVYDYIIVGAGSAGSTLAHRLSANKHVKILLLEAGPLGGSLLDVPMAGPALQLSSVDWQYKTTPQENACLGLQEQRSNWPMGKIFGGTSRLNNMLYVRGHPNDYKSWFRNLDGFDYDRDILHYFKKAERQAGNYQEDSKYHSTRGPLPVVDLPFTTVLSDAVLQAAEAQGFPIRDLNAEHSTGFMKPQVNLQNGARYTRAHYLLDHRKHNLHIKTQALAYEILFRSNFEAYGVKYSRANLNLTAVARRAVILSAGVIGTPKILMLSGLGHAEHLKNKGITPKIDLPVGDNLQDHVTTGLDLITLNASLGVGVENSVSPKAVFDYFLYGSGVFTHPGCEAIGITDLSNGNPLPDLQFMLIPLGISNDAGIHIRKAMGISDEAFDYFQNLVYENVATILPIVLHPRSRGTVRLFNKNIESKPIINPNYLSHQYDVDVLVQGIELIKTFLKMPSLQRLGAKLNTVKFPGCEMHTFDTKKYWECYVRHLTITSYHPIGTCRFGKRDDENSVVDFDFKVRGTNKLFIADASVIPSLPSGNINAAVIMLAEKAADAIKRTRYLEEGVCLKIETFLLRSMC